MEQLRKQAKDLHRSHRRKDPACCKVLRWLPRFARASDETLLQTELGLQEVQYALAMDYGFTNWATMQAFVEQQRVTNRLYPSVPGGAVRGWQAIVDVIAEILMVPAALIMRLHEREIEVLVSSKSAGNPYHPGDLEKVWGSGLYCEHVVKNRAQLLVPEATEDPLWANNPDIELGMVSYLGLPILEPTGEVFGTICVLDARKNRYSDAHIRLLTRMKEQIESYLELHRARYMMQHRLRLLRDSLGVVRTLTALVPICSYCRKARTRGEEWVELEAYLREAQVDFTHGICPDCEQTLECED